MLPQILDFTLNPELELSEFIYMFDKLVILKVNNSYYMGKLIGADRLNGLAITFYFEGGRAATVQAEYQDFSFELP